MEGNTAKRVHRSILCHDERDDVSITLCRNFNRCTCTSSSGAIYILFHCDAP